MPPTRVTGPIVFDPNMTTTPVEPTRTKVDPDAIALYCDNPEAYKPATIKWMEKWGIPDFRLVTRLEVNIPRLNVIAYRIKGVFADEFFTPLTTAAGAPIEDTPIVIVIDTLDDLPPGIKAR